MSVVERLMITIRAVLTALLGVVVFVVVVVLLSIALLFVVGM
jgi:hypothetical protein